MLAALLFAAATCPIAAPEALAVYSLNAACGPYQACANGAITWVVTVPATPNPSFGGYRIQPCDTVTWSFGDGTTQTLTGTDRVTHDYPLPGNYTVAVTVTNALGSTTAKLDATIATAPARLSFVPPAPVREGSGDATIEVVRDLDLSRAVSADAVLVYNRVALLRVPLQFAPGETHKSFVAPIADDHVYSGRRLLALAFENPRGGVLTQVPGLQQPLLAVEDDDPPPTLSIEPAVTVAEGDAGVTVIDIPLHLSAPLGVQLYVWASVTPIAITWNDVASGGNTIIPPGKRPAC